MSGGLPLHGAAPAHSVDTHHRPADSGYHPQRPPLCHCILLRQCTHPCQYSSNSSRSYSCYHSSSSGSSSIIIVAHFCHKNIPTGLGATYGCTTISHLPFFIHRPSGTTTVAVGWGWILWVRLGPSPCAWCDGPSPCPWCVGPSPCPWCVGPSPCPWCDGSGRVFGRARDDSVGHVESCQRTGYRARSTG